MEKFKTLESCVQNENQILVDLMKSLKIFTGQEIQALQKMVVKSFESLEELVRTDNQGDEVQAKDSALSVYLRVSGDLPKALATYPVITFEGSANTQYKNGYKEYKWKLLSMKDLKEFKQTVVSYGIH